MFNNDDWLNQLQEDVVDPGREIVDPHHHLWPQPDMHYGVDHLLADIGSGHNVVETVFMECGAAYREDGPDYLKPVGETEFVASAAATLVARGASSRIAGIISHADLTGDHLDDVLDAHDTASRALFRGIRHAASHDPHPEALTIPGRAVAGLMSRDDFRQGVALLGARGLTYDTWLYHHQIPEYRALAEAVPGTTMILDHFGTPLGVGPYAGKRDEIFAKWKDDIAAVAEQPNVYAKLGGLAMPDNGYGWHEANTPPDSDTFVAVQQPWYDHMIHCFGPQRCMFESNFPVDRLSIGYRVLWNGLKKIASKYSEADQDLMFSGVARRIYKL